MWKHTWVPTFQINPRTCADAGTLTDFEDTPSASAVVNLENQNGPIIKKH